jgi:carbon-monoxide dehydrogenase medium subunit
MKPRAFDYYAPTSLDEALALLAHYGARARPLAGGQSLVQLMNMREVSPEIIVDLNHAPELAYVHTAAGGGLVVGAMTRLQHLATSTAVRGSNAAVTQAANQVAFPAVRSRGTLGGNVAHAEPGAQLPLVLSVLDAQVTVARQGARRTMPLAAVFGGARVNTLAPEELLVEVWIPPLALAAGYAICEFRRGHSGPPLVTVATILELDDAGAVVTARMGVSGASDVPLRLREEEALLVGQTASEATFASIAERAAARAQRGDPVLAGVDLRRRAVRALLLRALIDSAARATQAERQEGL